MEDPCDLAEESTDSKIPFVSSVAPLETMSEESVGVASNTMHIGKY